MEPPFLATELRKHAVMAHLRMLYKKFVQKQIDWTGRVGRLSQKLTKVGVVCQKVGVASKNLHALRVQQYVRTPLLEILDPPLVSVVWRVYECTSNMLTSPLAQGLN